jgi:GT2 family glycosyltransferase
LLDADRSLGAVGTRVRGFPGEAVGEGSKQYIAWQNSLVSPADHARDLFVEAPLCHPSTMIRRSAFEAVGGYRKGDFPEDYDLWLRLSASGFGLAKVPRVLLEWRHHGARATLQDPRFSLERFRSLKAEHLAPRLTACGRPVAIWGAGPTGRRLARALEAFGIRPALFVDIDPKKIGGEARGRPIAGPSALRVGHHTVLAAVGARGARNAIRSALRAAGFTEGVDFICAA